MSSKTETRAKEILRLLLSHGKTSVEELTQLLSTSTASIRRDLARLEGKGLVHRTHGGVMLAEQQYEPFRFNASFEIRQRRFTQEKRRIAIAAAERIHEDETIGLTAGTTTTQVAQLLRLRSGLHIVTNAVNIAMGLSSANGPKTTLTGGVMRWPGSGSLTGPAAIEVLRLVVLDKVFLSVCGIDARHGATVIEAEEASVFRAMKLQAKQVIVVADSSKVGMVSPAVVSPITEIDMLITDDGVSAEVVRAFERCNVPVVIA